MSGLLQRCAMSLRRHINTLPGHDERENVDDLALEIFISEFFKGPQSRDELHDFERLIQRVIPRVSVENALALMPTLLNIADLSYQITAQFLRREPAIVIAALIHAKTVHPAHAEKIAIQGHSGINIALAKRSDLTQPTIMALLDDSNVSVLSMLAGNESVLLDSAMVQVLLHHGRKERLIAAALFERTDIAPSEKAALLFHADSAQRDAIIHAVAALEAFRGLNVPRIGPPDLAARLAVQLQAQDTAAVSRSIAACLEASEADILPFVRDRGGEIFVMLMRALDLTDDEIALVLRMSIHHAGKSSGRQDRMEGLNRLATTTSPAAARWLIAQLLGTHRPTWRHEAQAQTKSALSAG